MILLELSENNIIAFDLLVYDEDNINHREYISSFVRFKNELNVDWRLLKSLTLPLYLFIGITIENITPFFQHFLFVKHL